ncbi:MAG TPA: glycosyltransferase family 4 protein [Gemmataceae bacterium]|nr:glycosyltransferase family 4 protein [Gemmataceae bacterium]
MTHLLVSDIFPPKTGGSGRWFWEVYRRLPRSAYLIAAGEDPRQEEFDRSHDLRVVRVPLRLSAWGVRGLRGYARAVRRLWRLVRTERVEMLHCARCLPEGLMALVLRYLCGVRYLCYVHGEEMNYAASSRELGWLARRALAGAEAIIANSRNTRRLLLEGWGVSPGRVHLLHPGVDTTRFVPAPRDPAVRAQLGWGDRRVVLTVGRLQKRKGHDMMIRALAAIRRTVPDILYAIVGDGEERDSLQELAGRLGLSGHVQFLGELDDEGLLRCYQQCDLFVLPNRDINGDIEGFGIVLVEAQACGKAVVAGASGGTAETMCIPETGQVVPCEGPELLAELVAELLADPERRARMGEAGRRWVVERFDWSALTRQAEVLFRGPQPEPAGELVPS